jgi:ribosomal-protein-alanine N-acetyltransferase
MKGKEKMNTPILETKRILLRPLSAADAETIYKNWTSDPEVAEYMRWNLHRSVEETVEWLAAEEAAVDSETNYTWGFVLKENGELFGSGGIVYDELPEMFHLGYNIMKKYWSRGFVTEASKAIIDFASRELGLTSLYAAHAKGNPASGRVMEKLGFIYHNDCSYTSFDGQRTYESREYILNL